MGRKSSVKLRIDAALLKDLVDSGTFVAAAMALGVTRQQVSNCLTAGEMSPRMLAEIFKANDLSVDEVEAVLAPQKEKKKLQIVLTMEVES